MLTTGGIVVLLVIVASVVGYRLYGQVHRVDIRFASGAGSSSTTAGSGLLAAAAPTAAAPILDGSQNFLLMGSDSRDFAGGQAYNVAPGTAVHVTGQRSDVVMLLHIPAGTGKATVVSFPRDSWVQLPAYTDASGADHPAVSAKLNAAFSLGGAPLLVATIEQLAGLHIDHFAAINFPGFQGMVNALGGINVCIGTTRHDTNSGDFLTVGEHHVNGVQALALVRDRESFANQDLGRIKDQEYFLSVMLHRVLSAGTLTNPIKLTEFLNVATKSLTVDSGLSVNDMRKLASRFSHLDPAHVTFETVPVANANYQATSSVYGNQPQSNVELDSVASAQLFASLSGAPPTPMASARVPPADVSLSIENGTTTPGLARTTATALQLRGFRILTTGNAPPRPDGATVIDYVIGDLASAQTILIDVPGAQLRASSSVGRGLVLILGQNFRGVSSTGALSAVSTPPIVPASTPPAAPNLNCAP